MGSTNAPASSTDDGPGSLSSLRRYTLLAVFCLAQLIDAMSGSAIFSALPTVQADLDMSDTEGVWLISAFSLTFASFLLLSGKVSDVFDPKHQFTFGLGVLGVLSLGAGFTNSAVPLIVLRALAGCAAALTIPSALNLIINIFPDPQEQANAIGAFGANGTIGNIVGLFIGAMFVQWASWRWVFRLIACVTIPVSVACFFLIPGSLRRNAGLQRTTREKIQTLDLPGVSILTTGLILLIFAVTSGPSVGWRSAGFLAPLIISVVVLVAFFVYETRIPAERAAIPPHTWLYPNFTVLFFAAALVSAWFTPTFNFYISLWQTAFGWSAIEAALHVLPVGVACMLLAFSGGLAKWADPKWLIIGGQLGALVGLVLFQYGGTKQAYWPYVFPGLVIGSAGDMMCYILANVAVFRATPPAVAGTIGAIFNAGLQLGAAVGYAVTGAVQAAVDGRGGADVYAGRRAGFRVLIGVFVVEIIAVAILMKTDKQIRARSAAGAEDVGAELQGVADGKRSRDGSELPELAREEV